jgi:hypothetical protein
MASERCLGLDELQILFIACGNLADPLPDDLAIGLDYETPIAAAV